MISKYDLIIIIIMVCIVLQIRDHRLAIPKQLGNKSRIQHGRGQHRYKNRRAHFQQLQPPSINVQETEVALGWGCCIWKKSVIGGGEI